MSKGATLNQPDWAAIADKFDLWLPQLAPVGEQLLSALDAQPGDRVLDVGSGTGEPALTLSRQWGQKLDIVGVDSAGPMVEVADRKVRQERLSGIHFEQMAAEKLSFPDNSFDRAISRFGVMLFEHPLEGAREVQRVLKPGGHFALAVWGSPETMRTLHWSYQVFKDRIAEEHVPPLARVTSLGDVDVLRELLEQAGFSDINIQSHTFHYQFTSFNEYWDTVEASDILKQQYDALPEDQRDAIRDEIAMFAHDFQNENGLHIPHDYLVATGRK